MWNKDLNHVQNKDILSDTNSTFLQNNKAFNLSVVLLPL